MSGRPAFCRWLFFLSANVYNATLRYIYADRMSTEDGAAAGIRAAAARDLDGCFDILESALEPGPYLLGERYTGVDPYLWMLAGWQDDRDALFARCPRLKVTTTAWESAPPSPGWGRELKRSLGVRPSVIGQPVDSRASGNRPAGVVASKDERAGIFAQLRRLSPCPNTDAGSPWAPDRSASERPDD